MGTSFILDTMMLMFELNSAQLLRCVFAWALCNTEQGQFQTA